MHCCAGVEASRHAAFVLVAGGLGERLGYSDIKIKLPVDSVRGASFLQVLINFLSWHIMIVKIHSLTICRYLASCKAVKSGRHKSTSRSHFFILCLYRNYHLSHFAGLQISYAYHPTVSILIWISSLLPFAWLFHVSKAWLLTYSKKTGRLAIYIFWLVIWLSSCDIN